MQIVINRRDGGVSIMTLLSEAAQAAEHDVTIAVEAEIRAWPPELQAGVASWRAVPDDGVPTDRTFRNAWSDITPEAVIDHDMPKAREIWRNKMRTARAPKLAALDVDFMVALEGKKSTAAIAAKKQALRDVTKDQAIDAAQTPDELKAVWPDALKV